jgi:hypothetical protein
MYLSAMSTFSVSFNDPGSVYAAYYSELSSAVAAAGATWVQSLGIVSDTTINILIQFDSKIPTANGGSNGTIPLGIEDGYTIFPAGAMQKLLTGIDLNGAVPDGTITFGSSYLANTLWFDPNPLVRSASMPTNKVDGETVMLHELGHVLGFNGFINGQTGATPLNGSVSTFDRYVVLGDDGTEYFTGPHAEVAYGGPVPLTYGDYGHVANAAPRPGSDLIADLMNGVVLTYTRYSPSHLDVAILEDTEENVSADSILTPYPNGVYLFFDKAHDTQFLTSSASEKTTVLETRRDLVYEGVDLLTTNPANDANSVPIYRFFDTRLGTQFLTASLQERNSILVNRSDLAFEGVGFYEHATARAGDSAVYRFFDNADGTHFYTSDAGACATILATSPDFTLEGIGFYATKAS